MIGCSESPQDAVTLGPCNDTPESVQLRSLCLLAIDLAHTLRDLAVWWRDHQHVLKRLVPADLGAVTARKDQRKAILLSSSDGS